ncbi:MAG: reverse transcriptase domain-containing protein [Proteobacteria bacterium]|nr:reverse transcriptase domain-containing protein [Pseudomonadota bacterium]
MPGYCKRREHCHYNDDVWPLRFHWPTEKALIQEQLLQGDYYFSPCRSVPTPAGWIGRWNGRDALVLKAMSLVLGEHLQGKISADCYHLAGHGGAKACVQAVVDQVEQYHYVCRSDVNSYYASIDHDILRKQLADLVDDASVLSLVDRMLARLDDVDAELFAVERGITKGNPLSPILGAVYLMGLDEVVGGYCQNHGLFYARFMDDWIILCRRRQLRTVVRLMNQVLDKVKMTKHPC